MKPCPRCNRTIEEGAACPACNPKRTGLDELEALRKVTLATGMYLRAKRAGMEDVHSEALGKTPHEELVDQYEGAREWLTSLR